MMIIGRHVSGKPEDAIVNSLYFECSADPPPTATLDLIRSAVTTAMSFYTTYASTYVMTGTYDVKWYNMADPKPRQPVRTDLIIPTIGGAVAGLPQESAICLSYRGAPVSGVVAARRRGRIYTGPFHRNTTELDGRVLIALRGAVAAAGASLLAASDASAAWAWVGYSPTDQVFWNVAGGWVDNEWDTQRRRGLSSTVRSTF